MESNSTLNSFEHYANLSSIFDNFKTTYEYGSAGSIAVGFRDEESLRQLKLLLKDLSGTLTNAEKQQMKSLNTNINDIKKENKKNNNANINHNNEIIKNVRNVNSSVLKVAENSKKSSFLSMNQSLKILNFVKDGIMKFIDLQISAINYMKTMQTSGLYLKTPDGKPINNRDIFTYASDVGMSPSELIKYLQNFSMEVSGLAKNQGTNIITGLLKQAKEKRQGLGLSDYEINESIKSFSTFLRYMSDSDISNQQMINDESAKYLKILKQMSIATGKSVESILKETSLRDDQYIEKLVLSRGDNKNIATLLGAIGFSQADAIKMIQGVLTPELAQKSAISPIISNLISQIMQSLRAGDNSEELKKILMTYFKNLSPEDIDATLNQLGNGSFALAHISGSQEAVNLLTQLKLFSEGISKLDTILNDNSKTATLVDTIEKVFYTFSNVKNKIISAFTIDTENIIATLKDFETSFSDVVNKVLTKERLKTISDTITNWINDFLTIFTTTFKVLLGDENTKFNEKELKFKSKIETLINTIQSAVDQIIIAFKGIYDFLVDNGIVKTEAQKFVEKNYNWFTRSSIKWLFGEKNYNRFLQSAYNKERARLALEATDMKGRTIFPDNSLTGLQLVADKNLTNAPLNNVIGGNNGVSPVEYKSLLLTDSNNPSGKELKELNGNTATTNVLLTEISKNIGKLGENKPVENTLLKYNNNNLIQNGQG